MAGKIEEYFIASGRVYREDSSIVNMADLIGAAFGFDNALRRGEAGILSCDVVADAGESVALNVWLDHPSVVARVEVVGGVPLVKRGLSTGDGDKICSAAGLNMLATFTDNSQSQIIRNATASGMVLADGAVDKSILTDGTQPITVMSENTTGSPATISIFVTYYAISAASSLTVLTPTTELLPTTEMSDYGAN